LCLRSPSSSSSSCNSTAAACERSVRLAVLVNFASMSFGFSFKCLVHTVGTELFVSFVSKPDRQRKTIIRSPYRPRRDDCDIVYI
jgi:hypothetical protein